MTQPTTQTPRASLKDSIMTELSQEKQVDAERFAAYCQRLLAETTRDGQVKNPWMKTKTAKDLAGLFMRVKDQKLVFDGKHVTLQSTGVTYDYIAFKNRLLANYPQSKIDVGIVKKGDTFEFDKSDGKVTYSHKIADAFSDNTIVGAYCVIKNERGEFLTLLSSKEIDKHRASAKTDTVWSSWFPEMVMKTVIKKGCKYHFDDVFEDVNELDNESYAPEQVVASPEERKAVDEAIAIIDSFDDIKGLQSFYLGLSQNLIKNGDVFEAYTAKKADLILAKSEKVSEPQTDAKTSPSGK